MLIYVKLLLTAIFWGGTFIAGRTIAGSVDPFSAAFLRFAVASVLLAFLILGEPITWSLLTGGLLVISGVYLANSKFRT
jgi:drug/metabolite transporter (DMT)-like permease